MNKILKLVCRQVDFKKIVSIGFFAAFLAVFLSAGTAQASFWDWFNLNKADKIDNNAQQQQAAAIANADTTSSSSSAILTAKTGDAYDITSSSATIYGTINPQGENVSVYFKYRKNSESSGATKTTSWTSTYSKSNDVITSIKISDLSSGTKYVYRFYAYNYTTGKTIQGDLKDFITLSSSSSSSSSSNSSSVSSGASSSSSSVQQYTLKVKISGAGQILGGGMDCKRTVDSKGKSETKGTCNIKVNKTDPITQITLNVQTPSTRYEFGTWGESCRTAQGATSCTVKMNGNKTVSATFNKKASSGKEIATVSVRKTGKGVGKIVSVYSGGENSGKEDGRINCGTNCSENYEKICEGTSEGRGCNLAYFKAVPEKGSAFGGWGSDCAAFKNEKDQCYVTLDGAKTITANFNEGSGNTEGKYYDLTVTVSSGGTVATTDNKISCDSSSSPCQHSYGKNGTVTLKATPNSGYTFKDANITCSGNDNRDKGIRTCKVKMTKKQDVKINFKTSGTTSSSSSSKSSSSSSSASANHTASTGSATSITSTSATLNGTINPKGENVSYIFTYGKEGVSGSAKNTSWKSAGNGSSDVSVSANISGLSSGTEYYYWITAYSYKTKAYVYGAYATSTREHFTTSESSSNSSSSNSSQTTASTYKLKLTISGNGRVQDTYSKIDCGSNMACEATYSKGQVITLKTEDTDSSGASYNTKIESWSGGGCSGGGSTNACTITMDGDKEVTIKFVAKQ